MRGIQISFPVNITIKAGSGHTVANRFFNFYILIFSKSCDCFINFHKNSFYQHYKTSHLCNKSFLFVSFFR